MPPNCPLNNDVFIVQKLADTFNVILTITATISKNLPSSSTKMVSNYDVHSSPLLNPNYDRTSNYDKSLAKHNKCQGQIN